MQVSCNPGHRPILQLLLLDSDPMLHPAAHAAPACQAVCTGAPLPQRVHHDAGAPDLMLSQLGEQCR